MKILELEVSDKQLRLYQVLLVIGICLMPLFFDYPFRFNLFLAWEGAYRISEGQIPYKDFSLPMGFAFWIIPAAFFKIFGPKIFSLIIAQVFINLVAMFSFRTLLRLFKVNEAIIFFALLIFGLTYTLGNFWPWYNHSVFVFQLIALLLAYKGILVKEQKSKETIILLSLAGFFSVFAFFTKQDTGFLTLMFITGLSLIHFIMTRKWLPLTVYIISISAFLLLFILPFVQYNFLYWFNYGQSPHFSRVTAYDLLNEFFGASHWIKFYVLIVGLIMIAQIRNKETSIDKIHFFILTVFILAQASIIQITSYTPIKGNIYFHSFAFAYIFSHLTWSKEMKTVPVFLLSFFLIGLWWSGEFWNRYFSSSVAKLFPPITDPDKVVSRNTYILASTDADAKKQPARSNWIHSSFNTFNRIRIPQDCEEGMLRLKTLPLVNKPDLQVLNMTELTPLTVELGFNLPQGKDTPLWYHKNVSIFQKEIDILSENVIAQKYDLVLFQDIPNLNSFFPYEVRDKLKEHYLLIDSFLAPRMEEESMIEVYVKKGSMN